MALKKDKGIIIFSKNIGEADKMISLASEIEPKRKYYLRGIRKSKKRPIIASEIGSFVELDYYDQSEKEIFEIKEIYLVNRFDKMKQSTIGIYFISYLCELVDSLLQEGEIHSKEAQLVHLALEYTNTNGFHIMVVPFIKARLMSYLGILPLEFQCLDCGENILHKDSAMIDTYFEIHCGDCLQIENNQIEILRILHQFLHTRFGKLLEYAIPLKIVQDIDRILDTFLKSYLQKYLKTEKDFYKILQNDYFI